MLHSNPEQLCFPPVGGQTIRADFEGGALSSDFGALLLRGVDQQIGLTERLAAAIHDKRHPSYIDHPLRDLLAQRIYQIASGYADANDANHLISGDFANIRVDWHGSYATVCRHRSPFRWDDFEYEQFGDVEFFGSKRCRG